MKLRRRANFEKAFHPVNRTAEITNNKNGTTEAGMLLYVYELTIQSEHDWAMGELKKMLKMKSAPNG